MKNRRSSADIQMDGEYNKKALPGAQISEEMRAVMPDYPKWRALFFRLDCIFAGIAFLFETVFFCILYFADLIKEPLEVYLLLYLFIPTALNLLILFLADRIRKRLPQEDMRQNMVPVFAMALIGVVISMAHSAFYVILSIYCVSICMTIVFGERKMCSRTVCFGIAGAAAATIKHCMDTGNPGEVVWIVLESVIEICILVVMGMVAHAALSMTEGQKQKLIGHTRAIREEQHRSEAANIAKSAFLANMSHEIRTPINAILGMNEMILRENENEQIREYAESIRSAGSSLLYLVNDVLDISKIESGKLEIIETTYETSSFIHDCYNMVAERAGKKGLELKIECSPKLPSQLKGDEVRLRQVVTNLLSNAAKYTKKGSITLSADSRLEEGRFYLIITVKDTGIGIREENLKKLFMQFTRFDLEENRTIEGTGLGLAISRQLVELMHGEICVQSTYGAGSSFTVTVPQEIVDEAPMGDFHAKYREVSRENARYRQSFEAPDASILVVDDVEVNLRVIVNLLKKTKIRVDTALSGRQCLEMAARNAYDIIFMDHMMPEMNGVETYNKMKEPEFYLNKNTPVIMLTANAITGVKEQYIQEGFADYLAKPVLGDKLEKMILRYLPQDKVRTVLSALGEEAGAGGQAGGNAGRTAVQAPRAAGAAEAFGTVEDLGAAEAFGTAKDPEAGLDNITILQNLFQACPQADIFLGLSHCGQAVETYVSVLQAFGRGAQADELNALYEQGDAANYQTAVHGIKSALINAGFPGLSEKAGALEEAAQEGDWDYISANHTAFIGECRQAADAVSKAMTGDI